jgi:hypothetical protein
VQHVTTRQSTRPNVATAAAMMSPAIASETALRSATPMGSPVTELADDRLQQDRLDIDEEDLRPLRMEPPSAGEADALRGAGDDDDLS